MVGFQRRQSLLLLLASPLAACTIAQLHSDIETRQTVVSQRQAQLQYEQQRGSALQGSIQQLNADLRTREMSLGELNGRLDQIRRANAGTQAATAEQRRRKAEIDAQIAQHRADLAELQRDTTTGDEEKQRRLAFLKEQIRTDLELLVKY